MSLSPKVGHTYVYQAQAGAPRMIRDIPEEDGQTSVDSVIPVPHAMLCLLQDLSPSGPPPIQAVHDHHRSEDDADHKLSVL